MWALVSSSGASLRGDVGRPRTLWASDEEVGVARPVYELTAGLFKARAHPARIRVLELLRDGELPVSELIPLVGIEASHLSHQLATLRKDNLVRSRRVGSAVVYSVVDPRVFQLLEVAKAILASSLAETRDALEDLAAVEFVRTSKRARQR